MDKHTFKPIKRPDPTKFDLKTNAGIMAFNRHVDEHYKNEGCLFTPSYTVCDIYHGQRKYKASDFVFAGTKLEPNEQNKASGNYII